MSRGFIIAGEVSGDTHASGLIGSPTVPSSFKDLRDVLFTGSSPSRIRLRSTVGAVKTVWTLCRSHTSQMREAVGQLGTPSYISVVAPFASGP